MAKALGKRVELGVPVRGITQGKGGVRVHADGLEVHAKRVIVAIPPTPDAARSSTTRRCRSSGRSSFSGCPRAR